MPVSRTRCPSGGMPSRPPPYVAHPELRATTFSPSEMTSWTVYSLSVKAEVYHRNHPRKAP